MARQAERQRHPERQRLGKKGSGWEREAAAGKERQRLEKRGSGWERETAAGKRLCDPAECIPYVMLPIGGRPP